MQDDLERDDLKSTYRPLIMLKRFDLDAQSGRQRRWRVNEERLPSMRRKQIEVQSTPPAFAW